MCLRQPHELMMHARRSKQVFFTVQLHDCCLPGYITWSCDKTSQVSGKARAYAIGAYIAGKFNQDMTPTAHSNA